jgi:S1-C subfamily serine protease
MPKVNSESPLKSVERATVRVTSEAGVGQGVLIPGGYILTAAHCVDWDHTGGMALGDHIIQTITTSNGQLLKACPHAVEPCNDIAILGSLDDQTFPKEATAFENFCDRTTAADVLFDDIPAKVPQVVFILSHTGHWIPAKATQWGAITCATVVVEADEQVEGGTSGGPIVDKAGRLLGIVSWFSEEEGPCDGSVPRITALPYWAVQLIRTAQHTSSEDEETDE